MHTCFSFLLRGSISAHFLCAVFLCARIPVPSSTRTRAYSRCGPVVFNGCLETWFSCLRWMFFCLVTGLGSLRFTGVVVLLPCFFVRFVFLRARTVAFLKVLMQWLVSSLGSLDVQSDAEVAYSSGLRDVGYVCCRQCGLCRVALR